MLLDGNERLYHLTVRGQMGFNAAAGFARCARSRCGDSYRLGGIFSYKKTLEGKQLSLMKYYRPSNPQTTAQQAWRAYMAAAWPVYNALTTAQKKLLSIEGRKQGISGPNLFMSRYLQAHR